MDVIWVVVGVGVVALLVWAWIATQRRFSDEIFAGLPPGLTPVGGEAGTRVPVKGGEYRGEVAVAFNPPKGVRPGLAGTVVDGKPETRDVIATIVDLAARGYLRLTIVESDQTRTGRDWELSAAGMPPVDPIEPAERDLLRQLFRDGSVVRLSNLPRQDNPAITDHQYTLATESYERGWFRLVLGTQPVRLVWLAAGVLLMLGFALSSGAALGLAALAGAGGVLIGLRTTRRPIRTAEGTALQIQTLAFKKYLATAETAQFSYEEAAGVFSKYLPWAIVLGVADHWVKVFGDLAAQARADGYQDDFDLLWLGVAGWGLHDAMFTLAMFSALDGMGGDLGGFGDAFGDPGAMFDSGAIDAVGAEATGLDASSFDAGGGVGADLGGSDWGGSGGDWGGGFDGGGLGGGDFGGGGD